MPTTSAVYSWLSKAAFDAVHDIAFFQQKLSQVGAILTGDAGNEGGS